MIDYITDHNEQALSRLPVQHQDQPNIEALISVFAQYGQELEDAFQQLVDRSIDGSIGVQLDTLGRIVDQPRNGLSDELYRYRLKAKIAVNRSSGLRDQLIQIVTLTLSPIVPRVEIEPQYPAAITVHVYDYAFTTDVGDALVGFLRSAVSAGVRVIVEIAYATEDDMLYTPRYFTVSSAGVFAGASTLPCADPGKNEFPATGFLLLDDSQANQETVEYDSILLAGFQLVGVTALAHTTGFSMTYVDGIGKGLGDANNPLIGGQLASVQE